MKYKESLKVCNIIFFMLQNPINSFRETTFFFHCILFGAFIIGFNT